ncbi:acyl carrier protein [Alteromonas sp. a30]|uniref:acyl carrier protein n=1 Tax=Alteromonas sp. a30 TaxID=2730917 RepID=UPI00227DB992|nr:acyl carrier protein [Alteromonas sp. a30]
MASENQSKLIAAFATALNIEPSLVKDELAYNTIPEWDSTAHMSLVAEIEDAFDIMLDTDDIIDMSSVQKAKEIVVKYGVEL